MIRQRSPGICQMSTLEIITLTLLVWFFIGRIWKIPARWHPIHHSMTKYFGKSSTQEHPRLRGPQQPWRQGWGTPFSASGPLCSPPARNKTLRGGQSDKRQGTETCTLILPYVSPYTQFHTDIPRTAENSTVSAPVIHDEAFVRSRPRSNCTTMFVLLREV